MNTNDFFFFLKKKIFFEKRKNLNVCDKLNKMKGVNNAALLSGKDRHTTKNYITT